MNIKILYKNEVIGYINHIDCNFHTGEKLKLKAYRIRLDLIHSDKIFTKSHINVNAQHSPFNISAEKDDKEIFTASNVWIENIHFTYTSGNLILMEGVEMEAESILGKITPSP